VDPGQTPLGGDSLGHVFADVILVVEGLALKIGEFDEVAIDQAQKPHASARQLVGRYCSEGAQADNGNTRSLDSLLAGSANRGEPHLPGESLIRIHRFSRAFIPRQTVL
jgi:hypothetical protein